MNSFLIIFCFFSVISTAVATVVGNISLCEYGQSLTNPPAGLANWLNFNRVLSVVDGNNIIFEYTLPNLNKSVTVPFNPSASMSYSFENSVFPSNISATNYYPLSQTTPCLALSCPQFVARLIISNPVNGTRTSLCYSSIVNILTLTSCSGVCNFNTVAYNHSFLIDYGQTAIQFNMSINGLAGTEPTYWGVSYSAYDFIAGVQKSEQFGFVLGNPSINCNGPTNSTLNDGCLIITTAIQTTATEPTSSAIGFILSFFLIVMTSLIVIFF